MLHSIHKADLLRAWRKCPELAGSTLILDEASELIVQQWLARQGIDYVHSLHNSTSGPTPRFVDRVRWIATLRLEKKLDDAQAFRRLEKAKREEIAYWKSRNNED